jgi:hypothetical protein
MRLAMASDVRPGNLIYGLDGVIPLFVKNTRQIDFETIIFDCSYQKDTWGTFSVSVSANTTFNVE